MEAEEYQHNLKRYELEFSDAVEREFPLSLGTRERLNQTRHDLGLRDQDAASVEHQISTRVKQQEDARQRNLAQYEQQLLQIVEIEFPLGPYARHQLKNLQKALGLRDQDVQLVEQTILPAREAEYQRQQFEQQPQEEDYRLQEEIPLQETVLQPSDRFQPLPTTELPDDTSLNGAQNRLTTLTGVDYTRLRSLLSESKWREADEETLAVMLRAAGREKEGWLNQNAIANLPCEDLDTIDQLWSTYSNQRFGFSTQRRIYGDLNRKDATAFGDRVGWWTKRARIFLPYQRLSFSPQAREGHLPAYWFWKIPFAESLRCWGVGLGRTGCATDQGMLATLMARLNHCI